MLSLKPRPFVRSFFVPRYACVLTATRVYSFLPFLEDVAFSAYVCTVTVFSLNGKNVAHFPLSDGVFLLCGQGVEF